MRQIHKLWPTVLEAFQQLGGEFAAVTVDDHIDGLIVGQGRLVYTGRGQGVESIRQTHYLRADGDLILLQADGIAVAVPALVVIAGNVVGVAQIFRIAHAAEIFHQTAAHGGVGLDDLVFLLRQPVRLVQNGVRNGDLADVVQRSGTGNDADAVFRQSVFRAGGSHLLQQDLREAADPQNMVSGFGAAVLNDGGQCFQLLQMQLMQKQVDDDLHAAAGNGGRIRAQHHVGGAQRKSQLFPLTAAGGRHEQNNGDLIGRPLAAAGCQRAQLLGISQGQIGQHRGNAASVLLQQHPRLMNVLRLQQIVAGLKNLTQANPVTVRAANEQQGIF